jgi:prophage regulatory protein
VSGTPLLEGLVTVKDVMQLTGLARVTVYRMHQEGRLPKSINLSTKRLRWHASTIRDWLASLKEAPHA